ncbi:MAG: UDP-glucose 4-epimerase [bacterium ADurb.Bin425]|nr:MAG: UDP-glucose 4-epimerase [bacterium ADurb.Bin425]
MLLVTGAAGYIGSHFVRHYLAENAGAAVVAVDNLSLGHRQALNSNDKVVFYQTELADREALTEIMVKHKVSAVVHFAARAYVGESQQRPFFYLDNNVGGTTSLLAAMHAAGVEKLVFSSTCSSYGNPVYSPIDEKHPQNPINTYGTSKLMVEQMLAALSVPRDARIRTLSKGTREKMLLVLVMSRKAELYLLDEPIGGVDPATRDYILNTIIKNYDGSATILLSTHLIADVEKVLDEFIFLKNGVVTMFDSVDRVREQQGKSVDELFREVFRC